ncbi:MAG: tRNA lysidine(34) synthetase TilS [Chloroflexi bacterium]|nr:tRNA lysidine(34) synthetase TilS [Chloroflexota bacterium]
MNTGIPPILARVETSLANAGLLQPPGQAIVAAVSGGPDSLTLLHALHALSGEHPLRLHGAHLDHGLRGAESEADAAFVQETCSRLGVPCHMGKADVLGLQKAQRLSLEAAAREARYTFLAGVAAEVGASAVATGHTRDDQAETVLLHLARGAGLRGLRGMLPLSRWRSREGALEVAVARPLLDVTRQETEAFCMSLGLTPRRDASNADPRFQRNRLRLKVMPQLAKLNPSAREALARLAASAALDIAYLNSQVDAVWQEVVAPEDEGLRIERAGFLALHPSLQGHLLYRAYAELAGEAAELTFGQIEAMREMAALGAGREVTLGHGLRFFTTHQDLLLAKTPLAPSWPAIQETPLPLGCETRIAGWLVAIACLGPGHMDAGRMRLDPYHAYLDAGAVGPRLRLRTRRPGDRFHPLGVSEAKKLKDFLIDAHVPRHERDGIPLLVCEKGIAWVAGWRVAEWARVTPETQRVLEVKVSKEG